MHRPRQPYRANFLEVIGKLEELAFAGEKLLRASSWLLTVR